MAKSSNGSGIRQQGKRKMKRVKEVIQEIKKNWWIGGLADWRIQITQSQTHQSPNKEGGAE